MIRFLIITSYIIIFAILLAIVPLQIKSAIEKNNEIVKKNIKESINEQLKLKYAPLIDLGSADEKTKKKISLTKEQINLINRNISINTAKVDQAIQASNDEIGRDIGRVSTWITILLAGVGLLGVLVPIGVNFFSTSDLLRRMALMESNINTTNEALQIALPGISTAISQANVAIATSQEAHQEIEKLGTTMLLLDTLSKMKMLDFLRYNIGPTRERYIKSYFAKLKNCFESCKANDINPNNNTVFREACVDLNITSYQLFIYVQSNRSLLQGLEQLIHLMNTLLNADDDTMNQAFQDVITQLVAIASAP